MSAASTSNLSPLVGASSRGVRVGLFLVWLALVFWLAWHHVFWRDEVRAFTLALSGDGLIGMARSVQGEGHPILWYLALRLAHTIAPVREVLPAVGLAFGIAAAALFAARAPFRPVILATALFSGWMAYEYAVMARNYGIAALLVFVIADRMARGSRNGWTLGILLALLCNTNVPAVILAAGFLLFWLVELIAESGWRPNRAWAPWGIAATIALAGVILCFFEVYPPVNDAAVSPLAGRLTPRLVFAAVFNLGAPMSGLFPEWTWGSPNAALLLSALLLCSPFSLIRTPAGLLAALAVLPAMTLFFQFVYPGGARHHALYLVFLLALHWMVAKGRGGMWPARVTTPRGWLPGVAGASVIALLMIQVTILATIAIGIARGDVASRSRDLGELLARQGLGRAVVIADPDSDIEALPYYTPNPTWLVRERRYSAVSHFTAHQVLDLTLGDLLNTARALHRATGRPVVILSAPRIDPTAPAATWNEGYRGTFSSTPEQARAFLAATTRLASFAPATTDESYDVFLLKDGVTGS